jgi:phosphoglycerate dehydrogenase-like enzyme
MKENMTTHKLKIWSNVKYADIALAILGESAKVHDLHFSTGRGGEKDALALTEADIAFGQPDPEAIIQSKKIRWVHLDSAGYEKYDTEAMREALRIRGATLTNSSSVYDEPCAQHLLAMMMSLARRLPQSVEVQRGDRSWPMMELRAETYLLNGQTAILLGFGAIAKRLVELLEPFQMQLIAVKRRKTGDETIKIIAESEMDTCLPSADHVICTLPANPGTRGFVNHARFGAMKRGAVFYNIGRGSTVDQDALLSVLKSGHLAAAYLDVTTPEPLPPEHPLWTAPNCYITPHTAGGHNGERERLARHFLSNLNRFADGEQLIDKVF